MDSIQLVAETSGKMGKECTVSLSTGDAYYGRFCGYSESTSEQPLTLLLSISENEAKRIGVPYLREIGIPYEVIIKIDF